MGTSETIELMQLETESGERGGLPVVVVSTVNY